MMVSDGGLAMSSTSVSSLVSSSFWGNSSSSSSSSSSPSMPMSPSSFSSPMENFILGSLGLTMSTMSSDLGLQSMNTGSSPNPISNPGLNQNLTNSLCQNISLTTTANVNFSFTTLDIYNCSPTTLFPPYYPNSISQKYRLYEFIVNGFGITIVAILGIIGNILSAVVLSRPQMRSSVTCLLLGLAFCDSLLVFTSSLIFGLYSLSDFMGTLTTYRLVYHPLWVPYLYPISVTAQTASVYLTLAVTLERYVAIAYPLRAKSLCTWRRARYCVITVLAFAILYNLPRWFEVKTIEGYNYTNNMTMFENDMSAMRADPLYIKIYINWAYLVVMYMVPFTGLVAFNLSIYAQVRKANRERAVLSKLQRREMGLATMLLCVVVVFLLCNVLPLVNNVLESFYNKSIDHLVQTSNFLVVFNSSVNFVIYCTCGERFRRLLLRLCRDFLWCRLGLRGARRSSLYRKSHLYRGQHGGDFEDVSLASVANNHTCITTSNGAGNGTVIIDLTKERPSQTRLPNFRHKTIPIVHNHSHNNQQNGTVGNGTQNNPGQNGKAYRSRCTSTPAPGTTTTNNSSTTPLALPPPATISNSATNTNTNSNSNPLNINVNSTPITSAVPNPS